MKIKTTRYEYISSKMAKIMKAENIKRQQECRRTLIKIDGHVHCYDYFGKQVWYYLLKMKLHLSYDPAITLLGLILAEVCAPKQETHTNMFKAALQLIAPNQKQSKYHQKQSEKINSGIVIQQITSRCCTTAIGNNMEDSHSIMLSKRSEIQHTNLGEK